MTKKVNFFILIQGPWSTTSKNLFDDLNDLFPKTEIVISCYDEEIILCNQCSPIIVRNDDPGTIEVPPSKKPLNLHRQALTIYNGCLASSAELVLKIRSDLIITNKKKFQLEVLKFIDSKNKNSNVELFTLNTGSFNIFSFYEMPFHFNDWFFICNRLRLINNCYTILQNPENKLINYFKGNFPHNYKHKKRWQLRYHTEQLIHFGYQIYNEKLLDYCCEINSTIIEKQIYWVGNYLETITLKKIGLKSAKVGYPSLNSHLVSLSKLKINLHKKISSNIGIIKLFNLLLLYFLSKFDVFILYVNFFSKNLFLITYKVLRKIFIVLDSKNENK